MRKKNCIELLLVLLSSLLLAACTHTEGVNTSYGFPSENVYLHGAKAVEMVKSSARKKETKLDNPIEIIDLVLPKYPFEAKQLAVEGSVVAVVTADERGKVSDVEIVSSPHTLLSEVVIKSLKMWTFKPNFYQGKATHFRVQQVFRFRMPYY